MEVFYLFFWVLVSFFFVWENIDDLKFNTCLGGMTNKTYNHAENQLIKKIAEDELFFKKHGFFLNLKMLSDNPHFVMESPRVISRQISCYRF